MNHEGKRPVKVTGNRLSASKEDDDDKEVAAWAQGNRSVLDVEIDPGGPRTLYPPIAVYLDEVLLGMVGGAGDRAPKEAAATIRRPGTKVVAAHRTEALASILGLESLHEACRPLFWLVFSGIFGRVPPQAVSDCRVKLGDNWFALMLEGLQRIPDDRELHDAVFSVLPLVVAQAIYRLFVDGFNEDRKNFVNNAEQFLVKISQIAHFELVGFMPDGDAVLRARQRLFVKRVVQSPHMNQREFMRGRKRQEILEGHTACASEQPLEFGSLQAVPLEESQLEHVTKESDLRRRKQLKELAAGKKPWDLESTPVPPELAVWRHDDLVRHGEDLFQQHMNMFAEVLGMAVADDEGDDDGPPLGETADIRSPSHSEPGSPTHYSVRFWSSSGPSPNSYESECGEPDTPSSPLGRTPKHLWRKSLAVAKFKIAREDHRLKKDREAKAKKLKQEQLQRTICDYPLPKELSERAVTTTWVSPPVMNLARERDRQVLHKISAEAFHLKMVVPPCLQAMQRPASMPALRSAGRSDAPRAATAPSSPAGGGPPVDAAPASAATGGTAAAASGGSSAGAGGGYQRLSSTASGAFARGVSTTVSAQLPRFGGLSPRTLSHHRGSAMAQGSYKVKKRFEAQDSQNAFHTMPYSQYLKEHDVLTGVRKCPIDGKKLRDEELAYVKKLNSLVGGEPKRLIRPESSWRHNQQQKEATGAWPIAA